MIREREIRVDSVDAIMALIKFLPMNHRRVLLALLSQRYCMAPITGGYACPREADSCPKHRGDEEIPF